MSRSGSGRVVELLGAPGAGKSTLAAALGDLPGVVVVKDHDAGDRAALAWGATRSSWAVLGGRPADVGLLRWLAWAGRLRAAGTVVEDRLRRARTAVVLDQGPAYTLVRMAALRDHPRGGPWWRARRDETAALLDLLVVVDADAATLAARIAARRKAHAVQGRSPAHVEAYATAERRRCLATADALFREGTRVVRIPTATTAVEDQLSLVLDELGSRPAPRP